MKIKNLIAFVMSLVVALGMTACSNNDNSSKKDNYKEPDFSFERNEYCGAVSFGTPAETMDYIDTGEMPVDIKLVISCLKAIVNPEQPRIFTDEKNYNWLERLNIPYNVINDPFDLLKKYEEYLPGVIIYDTAVPHTLNLARSYFGIEQGLVCSYVTYLTLKSQGFDLKVIKDFRGEFKKNSVVEVYDYLYDNYWNKLTHRTITGLNLEVTGEGTDYGLALGSAFVWLDMKKQDERDMLDKFLSDMEPGKSCYLGWWQDGDETAGQNLISSHGLVCLQSNENMIFFSGLKVADFTKKAVAPVEKVENKLYIALCVSEGDNGRYIQQEMVGLWENYAHHGEFPISWSLNPMSIITQPAVIEWFLENKPENAAFYTGPSGLGYTYTDFWNTELLARYYRATDEFCKKMGVKVINLWRNADQPWIDEISKDHIKLLSDNLSYVSAVFDQAYCDPTAANGLLVTTMSVPYSNIPAPIDEYELSIIGSYEALAESNYSFPQFLSIQATPWQTALNSGEDMYDTLYRLYRKYSELYGDKIEFVNIEEMAMLQRLYVGMNAER